EILPALKSGLVVVCDRYIYSSVAYQGYAKGLDPNVISEINSIATERLDPDLVFLLDIEPELSFGRKISDSKDRFEKESTEFHNQVRKGYLSLAKSNTGILNIMDGQKPKKEIQDLIWQKVSTIIG
ncbi:MAG: dTMP kinase, partial [Chloroflexota bacterium]|nr:dTMP kinase [Chloroflexota bacterium]